ncbi:MAG TPA: hypothetical protein VMU81_27955 [Acetobacteraceae bacterium]|nr:hypothetical protein [Acetobacteraceae bacterium]
MPPTYDFNVFERRANELIAASRPKDAMAIYLFMADGDPSLDAGYLAERIGYCCELLGDQHAARWWYGRAVEENPGIARYQDARRRLEHISVADLFSTEDWRRAQFGRSM